MRALALEFLGDLPRGLHRPIGIGADGKAALATAGAVINESTGAAGRYAQRKPFTSLSQINVWPLGGGSALRTLMSVSRSLMAFFVSALCQHIERQKLSSRVAK